MEMEPEMEMGSSSSTESLNGLKFGRKIFYFDDSSSSSGPVHNEPNKPPVQPKKTRSNPVQTGQPPRCQVEGCYVDLTDAKTYYSRHKVCGICSKSPKVTVNGIEQRFCQQCSRFHQLQEFDQGKRSCRRRLAGHNERRRKPPPSSLISTRYESGSRGGRSFLMDFSAYPSERLPIGQSSATVLTSGNWGMGMMVPPPPPADSSRALSLLSDSYQRPHRPRPISSSFGTDHHRVISGSSVELSSHFPAGNWGGPHHHQHRHYHQMSGGHVEVAELDQGRRPYDTVPGNSRDFDDSSAGAHHHHHHHHHHHQNMNWSL